MKVPEMNIHEIIYDKITNEIKIKAIVKKFKNLPKKFTKCN